ncbi:ogr/Delta-like zinc finger family protein [Klebsiella huaxiensis]|uniref:ogr/Delta-like zinc finger family protein n=1 Tax=Klebsiella huaxiensis TaxID=2153354 RepID=UPI0031612D63
MRADYDELQAAHTRSSFQVSNETKERYNQCTNIECGHTFVTHETFVRSVCRPQKISAAPPHPSESGQASFFDIKPA